MNIPSRFTIEDDDPELLGRFTVWMEWVVSHAAIDFLRRQDYRKLEDQFDLSYYEDLIHEDPLPAGKDEFDFAEDKLAAAFSKLSLLRRRILTLIFVEDLPAREVADKLRCSVDYVYKLKHRALKALRDQLMEGGGGRGE